VEQRAKVKPPFQTPQSKSNIVNQESKLAYELSANIEVIQDPSTLPTKQQVIITLSSQPT